MEQTRALNYFYLPVSFLALLYVVIRAALLNVTYDEANTIIDFVPNSVMNILNHTPPSANNHILHTLLIKLFFVSGNHSLFVARLPNILSFLLYLFFSYRILNEFVKSQIALFIFLILILNPFLLDFFSLARGYGLSLGLEMASLYYMFRFFKETRPRDLLLVLSYACLTVLANLSALNLYLFIMGIASIQVIFVTKENRSKNLLSLFSVTLILTLIVWEPLRKLKESGYFWYGGNNGFYNDTLTTLANYSFYSAEPNATAKAAMTILLVVICSVFVITFKPRLLFSDLKNVIIAFFLLLILSVNLQFYLLGTLFLIDRSALFIYPVGMLLLGFCLHDLKTKKIAMSIACVVLLAFGLNFLFRANFYKSATWFFEAHTVEILDYVNEEGKRKNTVQKLNYAWPFAYSMRYHTENGHYPFVELVQGGPPEVSDQFHYWVHLDKPVDKSSYNPPTEPIHSVAKDTVRFYKEESVWLFKRRFN